MLDKLEIYPYQRLREEEQARSLRRKFRNSSRARLGKVVSRLKSVSISAATWQEFLTGTLTRANLLRWAGALILARAFILGEILPFAFAFAAAFAGKDRSRTAGLALFSLIGFATVASGYLLYSNIVAILVMLVAFQYVRVPAGKRWIAVPVITASLLLTTKSVFLLFTQPSFYKEMIIIFEALISGVLTFVMMVAHEAVSLGKDVEKFTFEDMTAFTILGIGIALGLTDVTILGLSPTSILCRLGILVAAFLWGSGGATMVGVLAGVIPAVSSQVFPQMLGMYTVSGLVAGLFRNFGRLGVIIGFMLGSLLLSIFIVNTHEALLGVWETAVAALAFFLLPESLKEHLPVKSLGHIGTAAEEGEAALEDEHLKEVAQDRINRLAHIFEELSLTFAETEAAHASKAMEKSYLNMLFDEVSRGFCKSCRIYGTCWEKEFYRTYKDLFDVFSLTELNSQVDYDDLPVSLRKRCIRPRELAATVNHIFESLRMKEYWEGRLSESKELISNQLRGMSAIIKNLAEELNLEASVDQELKARLLKECKRVGVRVTEITPVRTAEDQVYLRVVAPSCLDRETCDIMIAPTISSLMAEKYEVCERKCPHQMGKGGCEFILARAFGYRVVTGAAQLARERVSGDSFTVATLKDGKELLVLSDGMGVGKKASMESRAVVNLLEELLTSGFAKDMALKTINSILLLRSPGESFATVDLCIVDLYSAQADFVKIGSAPTFIKRGRQVGVISSNTPPIGILNNLETVVERRTLMPGDLVVMVTDGVLDSTGSGEERDQWLEQLLASTDDTDLQRLADRIINRALERARGKPRDDMTVLVARIESCQ